MLVFVKVFHDILTNSATSWSFTTSTKRSLQGHLRFSSSYGIMSYFIFHKPRIKYLRGNMRGSIILIIWVKRIFFHFFFSFIFVCTRCKNRFCKNSLSINRSFSFLFHYTIHYTFFTQLRIIVISYRSISWANNYLINNWMPLNSNYTLLTHTYFIYF
jgi:hypothetical protein